MNEERRQIDDAELDELLQSARWPDDPLAPKRLAMWYASQSRHELWGRIGWAMAAAACAALAATVAWPVIAPSGAPAHVDGDMASASDPALPETKTEPLPPEPSGDVARRQETSFVREPTAMEMLVFRSHEARQRKADRPGPPSPRPAPDQALELNRLIAALNDPRQRPSALAALEAMDARQAPALVPLLDSPLVEVRHLVARIIGRKADAPMVAQLAIMLTDPLRRSQAAAALVESSHPLARQALSEAQRDPALASVIRNARTETQIAHPYTFGGHQL